MSARLSDAETRAELERIDPGLAGLFDDLLSTVHPERNDLKALRLLAEKHKALREIGEKFKEYEDFDAPDREGDFLKCNEMINEMNELARNHCKEE